MSKRRGVIMAIVAAFFACGMAMPPAFAAGSPRQVLDYKDQFGDPGGVSDETTKLNIAKLESDSSEYVIGSHLAIFTQSDYESGDLSNPVEEWWTGSSTHQIAKHERLNSATTEAEAPRYVLVELEAPQGYLKAEPVHFYLISDDHFETTAVIVSGETKADGSKNCELTSKFTFALYDDETTTENEIVSTNQRRGTGGAEDSEGASAGKRLAERLSQTSDPTSFSLVLGVVAVGIVLLALGLFRRGKSRKDDAQDDDAGR
jgi:hypothetical protein